MRSWAAPSSPTMTSRGSQWWSCETPPQTPPSSPPLCPGCILTLFTSAAPSLDTFPLPCLNSVALTKHTRDWTGLWAW